jgi:hypothetical protein
MRETCTVLLFMSCCALSAQTAQQQVIPSAYAQVDANSYEWIGGASQDRRQQTLIGASHLLGLRGRPIIGFSLRRTADNEAFIGGTANMTVKLSTSPRAPLTCSDAYAGNIGLDEVTVFQGPVTLPTSPADAGPNITWDSNNIVQVTFTTPFVYQGGTLCIDVLGSAVSGQNADWWMADAVFEDLQGTQTQIGNGCGAYGGIQGEWSFAATRTLLPGAYAKFWAHGTPNSLGIAVFGAPSAMPIPLTALGLPLINCFCHLNPGTILGTVTKMFVPQPQPQLAAQGGIATCRLHIPSQPWTLGMQLATQWLDLAQPASSNAIRWTIANNIPTLDMALIEGHPLETTGEVSVHLAHVIRLDYQGP